MGIVAQRPCKQIFLQLVKITNNCEFTNFGQFRLAPLSTKLSPVEWALPATTRKAYSIVGVQCPPYGYWEWCKMSLRVPST
jgi:transposase